ncbi:MAG: HIT family protein [Micropruina sp.]|uniref:HIT family protein n=1 Tax=Micropruina sp. TaxID=2737536 RepID=UPI0039E56DBB
MACLFCSIVAGDIPARRVYEDDHAIAFLDINPWKRGHTLVIPRRHVDDLLDADEALTEIAPAIGTVARLLTERLDSDGLNLLSNTGAVAGQEVFHLHVHLVPRYAENPGLRRLLDHDSPIDIDEVYAALTAS